MFAIVMCLISVANVHLDHLKLYVMCINGRRYVCWRECYVVTSVMNTPDL